MAEVKRQVLHYAVASYSLEKKVPYVFTNSEIKDKLFLPKGPYTTFLIKPKGSTISSS